MMRTARGGGVNDDGDDDDYLSDRRFEDKSGEMVDVMAQNWVFGGSGLMNDGWVGGKKVREHSHSAASPESNLDGMGWG